MRTTVAILLWQWYEKIVRPKLCSQNIIVDASNCLKLTVAFSKPSVLVYCVLIAKVCPLIFLHLIFTYTQSLYARE